MLSRVLRIFFLVLLLIVMGGAAFGLTKYILMPNYTKFKIKAQKETKEGETERAPMGQVYIMKSISVNPLYSNGSRFVVAGLAVEFTHKNLETELKARDPQIRDALIRYFRRHTADQMLDIVFQEKSRREITEMINALLKQADIDSLYYIELILQ
ncbi:MAG: flagellar basal body-associated FliL family protein [Candidatus Marinimicrobia bacterium]|nr:flagellar basal body-associated FliL family protein [Candidatus Neomarinimicrobiota bacterium]MCF7841151.1 flagellar basal body-associated FliL family protein [Candidatus Neomarinimicrobiota bacterium]MCF7901948.1 flagellar basal body-associated FliL family protein [Candidatus Neomarinimicrobiota bacterium]